MGIDPSLSIMGFVAVLVNPEESELGRMYARRKELHGCWNKGKKKRRADVQSKKSY